ncbi:hypothetical protein DFA_06422 [Cavenderia fasciculata]|uniref:Carbohydrate binding domain-containing protein n=1 Tax=Cavenderia fasciculata TaxID=261658 RepID=F4PIY6_CACFS|nr:uncharacterized protein DFA_06422 [Cavenderia fasciculata]EGG24272.1 hypothetical protein DFA_06422 [Cavenderia fasciculata]|eukprot:XP_004362123.1 hypothetical protein DFA_06422 [Cavenderia fasciculata]
MLIQLKIIIILLLVCTISLHQRESIVVVMATGDNCMIGGWTADSCVENQYYFGNEDYTISFNNTELNIPQGWKLTFMGKVTIDDTVNVTFNCKNRLTIRGQTPLIEDCKQIELFNGGELSISFREMTFNFNMTETVYTATNFNIHLDYLIFGVFKPSNGPYGYPFINTNIIGKY